MTKRTRLRAVPHDTRHISDAEAQDIKAKDQALAAAKLRLADICLLLRQAETEAVAAQKALYDAVVAAAEGQGINLNEGWNYSVQDMKFTRKGELGQ